MSDLKNVTVKNFTEDGVEYLKLTGIQKIGDEEYTIELSKIKLGDIEIVKTDGEATHIQLPLEVGECGFVLRESCVANRNGFKNDSEGQVLFNQTNIKNEGEVDNMKSVTVKLSLGEVTQTGDKVEVPLLLNGEYVKTISATIGQDGKLHRERLNETKGEVNNMEIKIGNSSLIITNEKGVTIELDSIRNRIHDKKIRKYEGDIIGEVTTVLSFKFINDLSKTKDYFNVGEKYVVLAKDTIVDENNNLVRQNEITDLGTLRILEYNEEKDNSDSCVISEVIFRSKK